MAKSHKKIIVIGAGIGGSAVAALLQQQGNDVTLLERNNYIGGKCTSLEKDGFLTDFAFHIFARGEFGPLGEVNRRLGGDLRWVKTHPAGHWYFQNHGWFSVPDNPLWAIPYGGAAYLKGVIRPGIINTLHKSLKNYGIFGLLQTIFKIVMTDDKFLQSIDEMSMQEFLLQFTDDAPTHRLMALFSFLSVVIPYTEASAGELLYCITTQLKAAALSYPVGGAREIPGSYARSFVRSGGNIRRGVTVKRIIIENGKARGVELEDGEEILADTVISNAGIKSTVGLIGEKNLPAEYVTYVDDLKYSYSANIIRYGMDCRMQEVPKNFFQYVSHEEASNMAGFIKSKSLPEDAVSFALIKPTDWDPYLAPMGKEIFLLGTIGPNEVTPENTAYCDKLLDITEKQMFDFFPRVKDHIEWSQRVNVKQTAALTGRSTGECIGLAQCAGQTGAKRPKVQTPIEDLWLVGSDAGARGIGTEIAADSALYVSSLLGAKK